MAVTAQTGKRDAEFCIQYAAKVGAPAGTCIYFAIDTDASASPISQKVGVALSGSQLLFMPESA
jgi:hypothetical protein